MFLNVKKTNQPGHSQTMKKKRIKKAIKLFSTPNIFFRNVGWLVWLKYLSWFQYGFAALMINQWSDITNITCPAPAGSDSFLQTTTLPSMFDIENYTAQNLTGQSGPEFTLPCIRTGRQVLDQLNFNPVSIRFDNFAISWYK